MVSNDAIPEQASKNGLGIRRFAYRADRAIGESKKPTDRRQPPDSQTARAQMVLQLASKKDGPVVLPDERRQQGPTTLGQKDFVHFVVRVLLHRG